MIYKCYFHPKVDGQQSCRGCHLPVCGDCHDYLSFCPECSEKHAAVAHLRLVRRAQMVSGRRQASRSGRLRLALRHVGGRAQQLQVATAILQGLPDLVNGQTMQLSSQPARTSTMSTHRFNVPQRASRVTALTPQRPSEPRSRGFQLMLLVFASVLLGIVISGRVVDLMWGTHHKPLYIHGKSVTSKTLKTLHRAGK